MDSGIRLKYDSSNQKVRDLYYKDATYYNRSKKALDIATAEAKSFTEKYANTPLGKLETSIQKGVKFAQDILGITDKKERKEWEEQKEAARDEKKRLEALEDQERARQEERERQARKRELAAKEELRHNQETRQRTETLKDFNDLSVKKSTSTAMEDMAAVNSFYYSKTNMDYQTNCYSCSAAYDLRRRGYDVEAIADGDKDGATRSEIRSWYNVSDNDTDLKTVRINDKNRNEVASEIENDLKQYGDGARGILTTYWTIGSGHAVVWEVDNGEVVIRDCQLNYIASLDDYAQRSDSIEYFRTDNREVDPKILEVVRNKSDNFVENNDLYKVPTNTVDSVDTKISDNEVKTFLDSIIDEVTRSRKEEANKRPDHGGGGRRR